MRDGVPLSLRPSHLQVELTNNREADLFNLYQSTMTRSESLRRVFLVVMEYHICRLKDQVGWGYAKQSALTRGKNEAETEFAQLCDVDVAEIRRLRRSGMPYRHVCQSSCGLGLLLMLGEGRRDVWERQLSSGDIEDILNVCERTITIREQATICQQYACETIKDIFSAIHIDLAELKVGTHVLAKHFDSIHMPRPTLENLVAAADIEAHANQAALDEAQMLCLAGQGMVPADVDAAGDLTAALGQMNDTSQTNGDNLESGVQTGLGGLF